MRDIAGIIDARVITYYRTTTGKALYYLAGDDVFRHGHEQWWPPDTYRLLTSDQARLVYQRCNMNPFTTAALIRTRIVTTFPDLFHDSRSRETCDVPHTAWLNAQERVEVSRYIRYGTQTQNRPRLRTVKDHPRPRGHPRFDEEPPF